MCGLEGGGSVNMCYVWKILLVLWSKSRVLSFLGCAKVELMSVDQVVWGACALSLILVGVGAGR